MSPYKEAHRKSMIWFMPLMIIAFLIICCLMSGCDHIVDSNEMVVKQAADRNGCFGDDYLLLKAIWKAENGRPGREFGIMNPKANTLDLQAGWCAASIIKSRARWEKAGKPGDFITFMGNRYCPPNAHPLNKNWVTNVTYWFNKFTKD